MGIDEGKMATAAAIAAAAIGAAGSIGGGILSSQGAAKAAAAGRPSTHKFPLPKYQQGLESYYTRLLAQNLTNVPPSFGSYVQSGGTETFPINNPGFTPRESRELGIVGPRGQAVPFVNPGQNQLTPEQALYLGYQKSRNPGADPNDPLVKAFRINQRIGRIEGRPDTPARDAREQRLRGRRDRL